MEHKSDLDLVVKFKVGEVEDYSFWQAECYLAEHCVLTSACWGGGGVDPWDLQKLVKWFAIRRHNVYPAMSGIPP